LPGHLSQGTLTLQCGAGFIKISALSLTAHRNRVMKTFSANPQTVRRDWFVVDASGKTLGRLATEVARRLRGKHKPEYTPHVDTGDYIVVVNAREVNVTGNKRSDKMYHRHTGYIGNLKSATFEEMVDKSPEEVIRLAVKGMLPKNPLGRQMMRKLKIFAGPEHKHEAQQPQTLEI
jgi:large subunit ribosomal protein L13